MNTVGTRLRPHALVGRRSVLKWLAAAVPAMQMSAHRGLAQGQTNASPRIDTRITRRGKAKRVLILGAGLSGLVAGYELMQAGHAVTLLEGRTRPGGRVYTLRTPFSDGLIAEAGAGRIPIDHHWTHAYLRQFGLSTEPFEPATLAPLLVSKGRRIPLTPDTQLTQYFDDLSPEDKKLSPAEMAGKYLVPALREVMSAGDVAAASWPPASLRKYDQYGFMDLFREHGASPGVAKILFSGAIPDVSALWGLRVLAATDFDHEERIKGGNDLLPQAMAAKLSGKILYDARVIGVEDGRAGPRVTFIRAGEHHSVEGDYLICTLPFTTLRALEFMPTFSALKRQAIREMAYASVVKVALQTPTRDWERQGLSGFAKTDRSSEIWSPAWNQASKRGILVLYQQGPTADEFDRLSPDALLLQGATTVQAVFPESKPDLANSTSYSWQLDEYARGAYGLVQPGQYYSWYPGAAAVEGRIHFAGEHLSATPGFMQGAITSGHRAAVEVNARA